MKPILHLCLTALLVSCSTNEPADPSSSTTPATTVTLTHAVRGTIDETVTLPATVAYLNKEALSAPIAGFVTVCNVSVGTRVTAGQTLYRIASKEQRALQSSDDIAVCATTSGIVTDVAVTTGNYASEGQTLCVIADAASRVFEISVPAERLSLTASSHCTLVLPDGRHYTARVGAPLATMDEASQTVSVVARASAPFLPEGMRLQAEFPRTNSNRATLLLPKEAVQTDGVFTSNDTTNGTAHYWVMKLRDDSTAVRVPVTIGRSDGKHIEILAPTTLTTSDRIVLTGGYGLEDGARVRY